jgi:hypothetical protein
MMEHPGELTAGVTPVLFNEQEDYTPQKRNNFLRHGIQNLSS